MFRKCLALVAPVIALAGLTAPSLADMTLPAEHARIVRLPAEASAVVIGNPSIADAMVHDGRTLILTGRLQGRTNVIALDRIGRVIYSEDIVVSLDNPDQVALFRGPNRHTLSCGDTCNEIPRVGDETSRTTALTQQQDDRLTIAQEALGEDTLPQ
ncbi:pilus assembly protein N-terminal domain-containing protein [Maricaulis sp. D1M11]|uniref:pilus assembly protein N-terminal domain-containing protein n=1 Tax=Maricaulis sp. D1M11 TaxID=3076117 RepID=UPI0039B59D55